MTVKITELPIGCWTKDYKLFLDKMMTDQEEAKAEAKKTGAPAPMSWIKSYEEAYTDVKPDFLIYMDSDAYYTSLAYPSQFEKQFKFETSFRTTNMVAFNTTGHIHKYLNTGEILEEFYGKRLDAYGERKAHELSRLATELRELQARLLFVRAVVEKRLVIANVEDEPLFAALKGLGLPALSEGEGLKGYEYLLRMRVDRLKASAVAELEREVSEVQHKHRTLAATSSESLWLTDLDDFRDGWTNYCAWRESCYASSTAAPALKKKMVRKPKA
jgi:DNA topoisomerase-2